MSVRQSISSFVPPGGGDRQTSMSTITRTVSGPNKFGTRDPMDYYNPDDIYHRAAPRSQIATLPPVLVSPLAKGLLPHRIFARWRKVLLLTIFTAQSKEIDEHGLSSLAFQDDCIITACRKGHVRTWDRPQEDSTEASSDGVMEPAEYANPFRDP